ncbi:MAG: cation:H+ antiporter [Polyangiales bacterium]|jgi:cation:H+ antiporter
MLINWLLVTLGLALLVGGGEALVRGASGIALKAKLSPAIVGLTIVAAGTSMPEFVVCTQSAMEGSPGLAIGNIVGSNIFNVGMILGLTAMVRPLRIQGNTIRLEWPVMMLAALQLHLLARDGMVDRLEGGFLLAGLAAFLAYMVWVSRTAIVPVEAKQFENMATASFGRTGTSAVLFNVAAIAAGAALLAGGSTALVRGAVSIASSLGVSDAVIGLTVIAAGTSMPELMTSLVASRRGQGDIAVGNVVGSSIFNILGTLGATALIHPLSVPSEITNRDSWWMLGASFLLFPLMRSGMRVTRLEGALLFAGFLTYLVILVQAA